MTLEHRMLLDGLRKLAAPSKEEKRPSLLGSAARGAVTTTALAVPALVSLVAAKRGINHYRLKQPLLNAITSPDSQRALARAATAAAMAAPAVGAAHGTLKHLSGTE
jgi:hypothetical protein